jgi:hypothetical protein
MMPFSKTWAATESMKTLFRRSGKAESLGNARVTHYNEPIP